MVIPPGVGPMRRRPQQDLPPVGIRLAAGLTTVVAAAVVASFVPAGHVLVRSVVPMVAVAALAAVVDDWRATASAAAFGFLVVNGFLTDRYGQLAWHGGADALRLLAMLGAACVGTWAGRGWRARLPRTAPMPTRGTPRWLR